MMTKLREMTFIFIWILVIAFVGLMVFEWGMDFTGLKSRSNVVGKIDGRKITIQEFQKAVQNAYLQEKQRSGNEPDEEQMKQLRDQVWETYVQRVLFSKEIEKRDIQVSDREIFLNVTQNPPEQIRQNPNFQTDNQFDMQKYQQALQNPEVDLLPLENYYRDILPFQKLQNLITSSVMVTEAEVKSEFIQKNQKARIKYLYVPVSAFSQDSVEVKDSEIKAYYSENKEDFKVEEKRKLNYVLFSTDPTADDSAKVYDLASELKKEADSGVDFAQLADETSEDPSVKQNHGDLGWFERDRMVKEFSEAVFNAQPGDIIGPVKTQFGLHIIKVHDIKVEDGTDKAHASHILLKFTPGAQTLEEAQDNANLFREDAQDEGFTIAADRMKLEVKQTPEFGKRNFIPGFGQMPSAVDWTFESDRADISRVYRTAKGYVVFELAAISPEGYRPFEEVRQLCKNRVEFQKRKELAHQFARQVQEKINKNISFQQIVSRDTSNTVLYDTTSDFTMSQSIPKVGKLPEVTAAAFTLEPGKISPMIDTQRGYYFIEVLERTPFDKQAYQAQRNSIRQRLLSQKKQKVFNEWYENLKKKADIEDNRDRFFAS